jgi:hypothetical protein
VFLALAWVETVHVLVSAELGERRELPTALVTAVRQLVVMLTDVLEESVELMKAFGARLQHAFVHLQRPYNSNATAEANHQYPYHYCYQSINPFISNKH